MTAPLMALVPGLDDGDTPAPTGARSAGAG
jgi:hypothetical protein